MVLQKDMSSTNGSLAERVERQLRPSRVVPVARPRRRIAQLVAVVAVVWLLGVFGAVAGSAMEGAGYQVDRLQHELTVQNRVQQSLSGQIASLTTASQLAADAGRLHVNLGPIHVASSHPPSTRHVSSPFGSVMAHVRSWLSQLKRLEAGFGKL